MNIVTARRSRGSLCGLGVAAAIAALLVVAAPPALAHPRLVGSTPANGATAESVTEVKLVFSGEIDIAEVAVTDEAGTTYQSGAAERSGTTVTQKLSGALPAGNYTVAYRVVGEDGHPIASDDLTFTASGGAASEEQAGAAASGEQPVKADREQAAAREDSGSGAALWAMIIVGLLVGIGIGLVIVFQAKRKHQAAGARD